MQYFVVSRIGSIYGLFYFEDIVSLVDVESIYLYLKNNFENNFHLKTPRMGVTLFFINHVIST
jgi:hypothetical protein